MYDDLFGPGPGSSDPTIQGLENSNNSIQPTDAEQKELRALEVPLSGETHRGWLQNVSKMGSEVGVDCTRDPIFESFSFPCSDSLKTGKIELGSNLHQSDNIFQSDQVYVGLAEERTLFGLPETADTPVPRSPDSRTDLESSSTSLQFGGTSRLKDGKTEWDVDISVARKLALEAGEQASTSATLELGHKTIASSQGPQGEGTETKLFVSHDSEAGWTGGILFEWKFR